MKLRSSASSSRMLLSGAGDVLGFEIEDVVVVVVGLKCSKRRC